MRITLHNRSWVRDADVRELVRRACRAAGFNGQLILRVYTKRIDGHLNGRASCLPGHRLTRGTMRLYIKTNPDVQRVARTCLHEAMHLVGATHAEMTEAQRYCTRDLATPWADDLQLRAKLGVVMDPEEKRARRRAHAETMLRKAITRRKRAMTIETKWRRRVRALSREVERAADAAERESKT